MILKVIQVWLVMALPSILHASVMSGKSEGMAFSVERVAEGLGVPWGMDLIDNEHLLITERRGRAKKLNRITGSYENIKGLPLIYASGQGGFLDVKVSPDYAKSGWIYFTYSKQVDGEGVTVLARSKLSGLTIENWQDMLVTKSRSDTGRHFGSRIAFDEHGHVYFTVGDRGERPNGQDKLTHAGSVLRLKLDGSVPSDNPFVGQKDALPEIWSFGHRNPQGLVYHLASKRLWLIEHGPRGGDEINLIKRGLNYGWPVVSLGKEYWGPLAVGEARTKPGMEDPVKYYVPSIAPGSLLLYTGDAFPAWKGNLFAGALKLRHLNRVRLSDSGEAISEERLIPQMKERIRALMQSPEGWIYFSTDSGKIMKIVPKPN